MPSQMERQKEYARQRAAEKSIKLPSEISLIGSDAVSLGDFVVKLDDGKFIPSEDYVPTVYTSKKTTTIEDHLQLIVGLDEKNIELRLINDTGIQDAKSGFLVEVFLSESDGLYRIYEKDTLDSTTGNIIANGFENYFILEVDK